MKKEIYLYKKGYRITDDGIILNKNGEQISGSNQSGYLRIGFRFNKKSYHCNVDRLQAFQKYGEALYGDNIMVRHLDGNSLNNTWENIAIGTNSDNQMDIPERIRISRALYATSFMRKYDRQEVKRFHIENGNSYNKTMNYFKISSKGTLHYILNK